MKCVISVYLWFVGFLYFGFFLLYSIIASYVIPIRTLNPSLKKFLRGFFKVIHTPVIVEGRDRIDPQKSYLYMSNHVSLFDIPLLGGYVPGFARGVEASRQHRWPIYGWAMGRLGNIPIDRENAHRSLRTIQHTADLIKDGRSIIILPEGHRTLDGKLRPFKKLPFYLAKQAECAIVPIGISGLFTLKSKGSWLIRPTKIKIKFGETIPVETIESLPIDELKELVRNIVQSLIEHP